MLVKTIPVFRWHYCEEKTWFPYTEKESDELERIYRLTDGRAAYYLEEDRLVDFFRKEEISKKRKERSVIRGTWFFEDDNQKLTPYTEGISKVLETTYQTALVSGVFEKCKVSEQPLRFVDKNADGTFRQYRYSRNGDILGRKVIRGYDGLVLPIDSSTPEPLSPRTSSVLPSCNSPSPTFLSATTTAMPVPAPRFVIHEKTLSSESEPSSTSTKMTSSSVIRELATPSQRATATMTQTTNTRKSAAMRMPSRIVPSTKESERTVASPLSSRGGTDVPYAPHPDVPYSPRGDPNGSGVPLSPRGGLDVPLSPRGGPNAACMSPTKVSPLPVALATRTQTAAKKEKLLQLVHKHTTGGSTPNALQTESDLRLIVQRLQEENSQLKTTCDTLKKEVANLKSCIPQTEAAIVELGKQTDEIANVLLDTEDELEKKNLLIDKLMDKIRRITGLEEVYIPEDWVSPVEEGVPVMALMSIQDMVQDFTPEDLDQLLSEI